MYLGLNISGHLNFEAVIDQKKILRPYTPISPIDLQGKVSFLIKAYPNTTEFPLGGVMSQWIVNQ